MSPLQKQPCKPKLWHFLRHASQMSLYVLGDEQIPSFSTLWPLFSVTQSKFCAFWFLLLMSGLHLIVCPLYCCSLSLQTVDWDAFTPALWRLFVMSLTGVLGFFFTALTLFLSWTVIVFLDRPVRYLLLSMPAVSFFFRTFRVVNAVPNTCAMALISLFF